MPRNAFRQNVCTPDKKPEFLEQWPNQKRRKNSAGYFWIMLGGEGGNKLWVNLKVIISFQGNVLGFFFFFF